MTIHPPFIITPRLMAGLSIDGAFISLEYAGYTRDGRIRYRYCIDLPDGREHEGDDLKSGVGGGSLQEGFGNLLAFLDACGEGLRYTMSTGRESDNANLFPKHIAEWAYAHSDELAMLRCEIEESETELLEE